MDLNQWLNWSIMYSERDGNLFSRRVILGDLLYQRVSSIHVIMKFTLCMQIFFFFFLNNSLSEVKWPNISHSFVFRYTVCLFGCLCLYTLLHMKPFSLWHRIALAIAYWCIAIRFALPNKLCLIMLLNCHFRGLSWPLFYLFLLIEVCNYISYS